MLKPHSYYVVLFFLIKFVKNKMMTNREPHRNIIKDILKKITPERQKEIDSNIEDLILFNETLRANGHIWNTDTSYSLKVIKDYGFNPIGITTMMCEETFIFNTQKEAHAAFKKLEKELHIVDGWWYGKRKFLKSSETYIQEQKEFFPDYEMKIYWL